MMFMPRKKNNNFNLQFPVNLQERLLVDTLQEVLIEEGYITNNSKYAVLQFCINATCRSFKKEIREKIKDNNENEDENENKDENELEESEENG